MLSEAPTTRHSAPGKSGALPRSLYFSLGTHARAHWHARRHTAFFSDLPAPLHSAAVNLFHASARKAARTPQRRSEDLKQILEELPARLRSRALGGAEGRTSCQQKRKVSIRIKLGAGKFNFRSTFRINFIIRLYRCREIFSFFFLCSSNARLLLAMLATAFFSLFISKTTCFIQLMYPIF